MGKPCASYYVTIGTLIDRPAKLSLDDIKRGSGPSTMSLPLCRRTEISKSRKVRGITWDICALGNGASIYQNIHVNF
ncbi:sulfite oxidase [Oryza sativa Japonica Group]|uniref:sulfite oxidase n=1 Tax=Oryza sativa subsp. japonica TaxID=39947 RepID=UPI00077550E5|nr:sulfite oxidase [Oryza sativa Japonica Group]XP_025882419.1 sulfite oxidase [Oryza sativa Japonica Group]XP_052158141.1 sulfite oxidase-like [Oryza glaberrima]